MANIKDDKLDLTIIKKEINNILPKINIDKYQDNKIINKIILIQKLVRGYIVRKYLLIPSISCVLDGPEIAIFSN